MFLSPDKKRLLIIHYAQIVVYVLITVGLTQSLLQNEGYYFGIFM